MLGEKTKRYFLYRSETIIENESVRPRMIDLLLDVHTVIRNLKF